MPIEKEVELTAEEIAADEAANKPTSIPIDALPEDLRSKSVDELKTLFSSLSVVGTIKTENDSLKTRLAALEARMEKPEKPAEPVKTGEEPPLEDVVFKDTKAAVKRAIKELGYEEALTNVDRKATNAEGRAARMMVKQSFPDFDDYAADVDTILENTGAAPTEANIRGAYVMAVGNRALMERGRGERKRAAAHGAEPPTPPERRTKKVKELTDTEDEFRRGWGMDKETFIAAMETKELNVEVPTGKAKA